MIFLHKLLLPLFLLTMQGTIKEVKPESWAPILPSIMANSLARSVCFTLASDHLLSCPIPSPSCHQHQPRVVQQPSQWSPSMSFGLFSRAQGERCFQNPNLSKSFLCSILFNDLPLSPSCWPESLTQCSNLGLLVSSASACNTLLLSLS